VVRSPNGEGREREVANHLRKSGFEEFVPVYRARRGTREGKEVDLALFPGYIFCRFEFEKRLPVLLAPGAKRIAGRGRQASPVPPGEVEALERVVRSGVPLSPFPYFKGGERVRVQQGSLAGLAGTLLESGNSWRLMLSVELLKRSAAVEVDRTVVAPLVPNAGPAQRIWVGVWWPGSPAGRAGFVKSPE
jgi:transcription antitermination factor NusG